MKLTVALAAIVCLAGARTSFAEDLHSEFMQKWAVAKAARARQAAIEKEQYEEADYNDCAEQFPSNSGGGQIATAQVRRIGHMSGGEPMFRVTATTTTGYICSCTFASSNYYIGYATCVPR